MLEDDGERIGTIWVGPHPNRPEASEAAWLYDIQINHDLRGRGYGRRGLDLVETHLAQQGVTEFALNVFSDNETARHLYTVAGYQEYAITMVKTLPTPQS